MVEIDDDDDEKSDIHIRDSHHGIKDVEQFSQRLDQILKLRCLLLANADPVRLKELIPDGVLDFEVLSRESLLKQLSAVGGSIPDVSSEKLLQISQRTDVAVKSRKELEKLTLEIVATLNLPYFRKIALGEQNKQSHLSLDDVEVLLFDKTLEALDCVKWNNSLEVTDFIEKQLKEDAKLDHAIYSYMPSGSRVERSIPEAGNKLFEACKNIAGPVPGIKDVATFARCLDRILELRCLLLATSKTAELQALIPDGTLDFDILSEESLLMRLSEPGGSIPDVSSEMLLRISMWPESVVKIRDDLLYWTNKIVATLDQARFRKIALGKHKNKGNSSSDDFQVFLFDGTLEALDRVQWNNSKEIVTFIEKQLKGKFDSGNFASGVDDFPTFTKCLEEILDIRCQLSADIDPGKLAMLCVGEIDESEDEIDDSNEPDEPDEQDESVALSKSGKKSTSGKQREIAELVKLRDIFKAVGSGSVVSELKKMLKAGDPIPAVSTKTLLKNSILSEEDLKKFCEALPKSLEGIIGTLNIAYFRKIVSNSPHRDSDESTEAISGLMSLGGVEALDRVSLMNVNQVVAFICRLFQAKLGEGVRRLENTEIISESVYFNGSADSGKTLDDIPSVRSADPEGRYLDNLDFVNAQVLCDRVEDLAEFFKNPTGKFPKASQFENPKRYSAWKVTAAKKTGKQAVISVNTTGSSASALPYEPTDYSFTDSGYDYAVEFVKFIDGTQIADTAWSVTEEVMRGLISLEWYLGARLTKAQAVFVKASKWKDVKCLEDGEPVARKQSIEHKLGSRIPKPDLDLALVTLEKCMDLLEGVLYRHNSKAYLLGPADPLSAVRVYELLGLIRAMIKLFPGDNATWEERECTRPSYWDLVWPDDVTIDVYVRKYARKYFYARRQSTDVVIKESKKQFISWCYRIALDDVTLQNIRNLASCAKTTITGYCNTGFALCNLDDEVAAVKVAYKEGDYLVVSQIYRKVLNQVCGFLKTYLVHGKNGVLPIPSGTGHSQVKPSTFDKANKQRRELWVELTKYCVSSAMSVGQIARVCLRYNIFGKVACRGCTRSSRLCVRRRYAIRDVVA